MLYATHIGDNFLQQVLSLVYTDAMTPADMVDTKIFVSTNRLAKALQTEILRKFDGKPTLMPQIMGISGDDSIAETVEFYGGSYIAPAVDSTERQLWLADVIWGYYDASAHLENISFAMAMEYAHCLARLFDNLHLYEVDFNDLLACVDHMRADLSDHWAVTTTFLQHFYPLWQQYLQHQGVCDIGAYRMHCYHHIINQVKTSPNRIFCVGFTATYPIIGRLLDVVKNLDNGTVILPAYEQSAYTQHIQNDPSHPQYLMALYLGDTVPQMLPAHRLNRHKICNQVFLPAVCTEQWSKICPVTNSEQDIFAGIKFMQCDTLSHEAMAIALALRDVLETEGKTGALITADKNLSRMVINILQRWKINIDDSSGMPLHLTPVAVFMQLVLDVQAENFTPTALIKLLKHPLCNMGYDRGYFLRKVRILEKYALRGYVIGAGIQGIIDSLQHRLQNDRFFMSDMQNKAEKIAKVDELQAFLQEISAQFMPFADISDIKTNIFAWMTAHINVAENLSGADTLWAGDAGNTMSETCVRILDKGVVLSFKQHFSVDGYTQLFVSLLYGQTVRKIHGLHPRLYIWGTLEGRMQTVDTVIFGGCNEGTLPAVVGADIWVSNAMANTLHLPTIDRSVGVSAHDVLSACNGDTVIFSRSQKQGGSPTIPSRWWQRFKAVGVAYNMSLPAPDTDYARLALHIDTVDDTTRQAVKISVPKPTPPVAYRPQKLSMTSLQTWYEDPYQIYARHVLKLQKLEQLATEFNPAFKGSLIHAIFEDFATHCNQKYRADPHSMTQDDALQSLYDIAQTHFAMYQGMSAVRLQIIPEFNHFAPLFVAEFWQRLQDTTQMYFEKYGVYTLQTEHKNSFTISGIADRIDITDEGSAIIVDYKTGTNISPQSVADGMKPQLILQSYMVQQGGYKDMQKCPVDTAEYWMTKRDFAIVSHETQAVLQTNLNTLYDHIDMYAHADTPYYTDNRKAKYNDYEHLFREHEWNTIEEHT